MIYYVFTFHYTFGDRNILLPTTDFWILRGSAPRFSHQTSNHQKSPFRLPQPWRRTTAPRCRRIPIFSAPSTTNQRQHAYRPWFGDFSLASLSACVPPHVCSPPGNSRPRGWSTSHFLLRMSSPEAAGTSPLLPQIDIDRIEPWRGGEGEYYVYSASNLIRNSPRVLLFSRRCSYLRGSRLLGLQRPLHFSSQSKSTISSYNKGETVSSMFLLRRISSETHQLFLWPRDVPPAGETKGRRGFKAPLNGLLDCSFAIEPVKKVGEQRYVLLLLDLFYWK